jgi:hypothetical protein
MIREPSSPLNFRVFRRSRDDFGAGIAPIALPRLVGGSLSAIEANGTVGKAQSARHLLLRKPEFEPSMCPIPREDNRIIARVKAGQIAAYANVRLLVLATATATADPGMRHVFSIGPPGSWVDPETGQFSLHLLLHSRRHKGATRCGVPHLILRNGHA